MNRADEQFLIWLRDNDPFAFEVVVQYVESEESGLAGIGDWISSGWDALKGGVSSIIKGAAPALKETAIEAAKLKAIEKFREKYGREPSFAEKEAAAKAAAQQELQNQKIIELQAQRAANGLPPAQVTIQPTVPYPTQQQVDTAVTKTQERNITTPLIIGGVGFAFLTLFLLIGRRR